MLMLPARTREHVITALGATPVVLRRLVERYPSDAAAWDVVVPGRFTPREHVAHMADWDDVFFERMRLTVDEDEPPVPNPNETQLSIDRQYASAIPLDKVDLFSERRERLIEFLKAREDSDWERGGIHPSNGRMTLETQAVHVLGHDGYHMDFLARMLA